MSLPRKLKNMNLFNEGESYLGEIKTVVLPKLTRKMEDYRGGGMNAPIKVDMTIPQCHRLKISLSVSVLQTAIWLTSLQRSLHRS